MSKILWLPLLTTLGEETVARIIERSPDVITAIQKAREEFTAAEEEAKALKQKGHDEEAPR